MMRSFRPEDLQSVLAFAGNVLLRANYCEFHPGDFVHWMSNGYRGTKLDERFYLYESKGELLAFASINPVRYHSLTLSMHPDHRGGQLELDLLDWCARKLWESIQAEGEDTTRIIAELSDTDSTRTELLEKLGFRMGDVALVLTQRSLSLAIPEPQLPEGFTIRSVAGEHEIDQVCSVHNHSFSSKWTHDEYLKVMRTPGFDIPREVVVVAPDSDFAAFTVHWMDPITGIGYFEPVGCHEAYQRRGLTRALMYEVMGRMVDAGMTMAQVRHVPDNPASAGLYAAVGFKPVAKSLEYTKDMAEAN